jgi:hypothetical protein
MDLIGSFFTFTLYLPSFWASVSGLLQVIYTLGQPLLVGGRFWSSTVVVICILSACLKVHKALECFVVRVEPYTPWAVRNILCFGGYSPILHKFDADFSIPMFLMAQ